MTVPPSPLSIPDHADPGDETQARFRYQHAYGVILALDSLSKPEGSGYNAIYCEHLEDLLAETPDGTFDAYQLKTRKPEKGAWRVRDDSFQSSVHRFIHHHQRFGEQLRSFCFVSNTETLQITSSESAKLQENSPSYLLESCSKCKTYKNLPIQAEKSFRSLLSDCGATEDELFSVLKRTKFIKGPPLDAYFDELVNRHLAAHPIGRYVSASKLQRLARRLIELFSYASALPSDPSARTMPQVYTKQGTTTVGSKRVGIDEIAALIDKSHQGALHASLDGDLNLAGVTQIGSGRQRLVRKLEAGGLQSPQVLNQQRRLLTAQAWLLQQEAIDPEEAAQTLQQLLGLVEGVHADAHARVYTPDNLFGLPLYNAMNDEFRELVVNSPADAANQNVNFLFGIAALLTEDCRLWWSEIFNLEGAQ